MKGQEAETLFALYPSPTPQSSKRHCAERGRRLRLWHGEAPVKVTAALIMRVSGSLIPLLKEKIGGVRQTVPEQTPLMNSNARPGNACWPRGREVLAVLFALLGRGCRRTRHTRPRLFNSAAQTFAVAVTSRRLHVRTGTFIADSQCHEIASAPSPRPPISPPPITGVRFLLFAVISGRTNRAAHQIGQKIPEPRGGTYVF